LELEISHLKLESPGFLSGLVLVQRNKYTICLGCMVPFSLRILLAELPQHIGKPNEALDRLYYLQRTCKTVLKNLGNGLDEDGTESADMTDEMRQGNNVKDFSAGWE
jgi:hypothetical protein